MFDSKIHRTMDGEPVFTVTLSAQEVSAICSALHSRHDEYFKRTVGDGSIAREPVAEGVTRSAHQLGEWCAIQETLSTIWWPWVHGEDEPEVYTCNACGDYFETAAEHIKHDCAETMGE